jgi:hypothetical protein
MTVGGHGEIEFFAISGAQRRQLANELNHAVAQQWFSTGQTDFLNPKAREYSSHAQVVGKGQLTVQRSFIPRAAIDTPVVAAIRDRDPQIGNRASEFVREKQL